MIGIRVGDVTICRSENMVTRHRLACPVCKRRTRHVKEDEPYSYYAPRITCVSCGDSWVEGELTQRPFRRGWRKEAIARAERLWTEAVS